MSCSSVLKQQHDDQVFSMIIGSFADVLII